MKTTFLSLVLLLGGCATENLAHLAVDPPNHKIVPGPQLDPNPAAMRILGITHQFRVPVGPPVASIYARLLDPPDGSTPRGTVLVIHGFLANGDLLLNKATEVANAGYRAVLVDLRGHGRSTGDYITFGVLESRDLSQVIDYLEAEKLAIGKIGVVGKSYGAATSIELAGRDSRIAAVVAFAPFSSMRDIVPSFGRTFMPAIGWKTDEQYRQIVDDAGKLANFNPDDASPLLAITKTKAPILLVHGSDDVVVPASHSEKLYAAAKDHAKLLLLPGGGHASVWADLDHSIRNEMVTWLDTYIAPSSPRAQLTPRTMSSFSSN